ncbi:MAG: peptidoglycan DD-metalloendopeptidase family protein [Lachnospiraceae bacterium]|nr:peptidoglycan DD-metalloendopeptidase family protein [Lachnospiraceae bacterium]
MREKIKKNLGRILALAICLSFMLPVYGATTADKIKDTKDKIKQREEQMAKLEKEQKALKDKIANLKSEQSDLLAYIGLLDEELDRMTNNLLDLEGKKAVKEAEIEKTKADIEVAKQIEAEQYESMKLRIKYMYEQGEENFLALFLNSEDLKDFLNRGEYVKQITEYDREKLAEFVATRESIEAYELKLEEELFDLELLVAAAEAEVNNMNILIADKNVEMQKYSDSILASEGMQNALEASWDEMEADLAELEVQLKKQEEEERKRLEEEARKKAEEEARKKAQMYSGGMFRWPLDNHFNVTSDYGYRNHPIYKTWRLHNGIDIGAPTGTPIKAAYAGTVVTMTYSSSAGYYVMVDHGGGVYSVYMHCSKFVAKVGQKVKMGDTIALVGSTGSSTAPHLHFSVRVNGSYVDPAPYIGYKRK